MVAKRRSHGTPRMRMMGVKLLLEREDVNPDRPDRYGQTPLSLTARSGYARVAKLLLEREKVSSDKPDNHA